MFASGDKWQRATSARLVGYVWTPDRPSVGIVVRAFLPARLRLPPSQFRPHLSPNKRRRQVSSTRASVKTLSCNRKHRRFQKLSCLLTRAPYSELCPRVRVRCSAQQRSQTKSHLHGNGMSGLGWWCFFLFCLDCWNDTALEKQIFDYRQKIAFSLISSIVDYFLYYVLLSSLLASSYGLASAPRQGVAGDYASHSDSSTASATSVSPNPTSSPSSARSASPQQTIDFASPSDVYAAIGVIREGCLSNGNNYCAAICPKVPRDDH